MGVYYFCPSCNSTLHLTPQSKGFGQMRVPCFSCGAEASYSPSGPTPGAHIVEAPQSQPSAGAIPALRPGPRAHDLGHEDTPNPTVPVQTHEALLALDAQETAATIPVQGLSDADLQNLLASHGAPPSEQPDATIRSSAPDYLASVPLGGDYDSVPMDGLYGASSDDDSTVPGSIAGLNLEASASGDHTRPYAGGPADEDLEEEIPTRSVAGLADRDIVAYASGLYTGIKDDQLPAVQDDSKLTRQSPILTSAPDKRPPRSGNTDNDNAIVGPAATATLPDEPSAPPPQYAPQSPAPQSPAHEPAPKPPQYAPQDQDKPDFNRPMHSSSWKEEPAMSNSMFNQLGIGAEPGFGDTGPQPGGQRGDKPRLPDRGITLDTNEPLHGLGSDQFTGQHPVVRRGGDKSNTGLWIGLLIGAFLVAFVAVLAGLFIFVSKGADKGAAPSPPAHKEKSDRAPSAEEESAEP